MDTAIEWFQGLGDAVRFVTGSAGPAGAKLRRKTGSRGGLRVVYFFLAEPGRILFGSDLRQIATGHSFGG